MLRRLAVCRSGLRNFSLFTGKFRCIPNKNEFQSALKKKIPCSNLKAFKEGQSRWAQPYKFIMNDYDYVARSICELTQHEVPAAIIASLSGIYPKVHYYFRAEGALITDCIAEQPYQFTDANLYSIGKALKTFSELRIPAEVTEEESGIFQFYLQRAKESDDAAIKEIAARFERLNHRLKSHNKFLCHGDFHPGNILFDGKQFWIIDLEFLKVGTPMLDIATLSAKAKLEMEKTEILLQAVYGKNHRSLWSDFKELAELRLAIIDFGQASLNLHHKL